MNKLLFKLKEIAKKNSYAVRIGATVAGCLIVIAGLLFFMPEGHAIGTGAKDDPIELDVNAAGEYNVGAGKYYKIPAGTYNNGIVLKTDSHAGDLYLILENAEFIMNSDEPAISFRSHYSGDVKDNSKLNVHIILEGSSVINGYAGGKEPLIKAENYSFATEVYNEGNITGVGTEAKATYYSQNLAVYIEEKDIDTRNSLTLKTGEGSYGAAIGSAEAQNVIDGLKNRGLLTINMDTRESNKTYPFRDPSWTADTPYNQNDYIWVYKEGTYLSKQERFEFGAAPVTIVGGVVNINGNGYGAGIGNGGCIKDKVSLSSEQLVSIKGEAIDNIAVCNLGQAAIKDGTVSVIMSDTSKGSCFVNGSVNNETAEDGLVYIDGGSVYLKRQCDYENPQPYNNAYNSSKQQLYLYEAEYGNDLQGISKDDLAAELFDLKNIYGAEENYQYGVSSFVNEDGSSDIFNLDKNYLVAKVASTSFNYNFNGYYHEDNYRDGDGKLYFYLPAVKLKDFNLKIKDNCTQVNYGTVVSRDSTIVSVPSKEILSSYTYTPYDKSLADGMTVKENSYVVIKAGNIPNYCTDVTFEYVQTNDNVVSRGEFTPIKDDDGNYYVCLNPVQGNIVGTFTYNMGEYNIQYNYGLLSEDIGASITNNNPVKAECGTVVTLNDPVWENHIFDGWYLEPGFVTKVTDISSVTVNDTKTVYAKWKCKVTYDTDEGTLEGTKEYTVDYGKTFDILNNVPTVKLPSDMESLIELKGWKYGANIYSADSALSPIITVRENITVTAKFKRSGYYVYITAMYGDGGERTDIMQYTDSFRMIYANNNAQGFGAIDSDNYYRTTGFVDKTQPATVSIVPKAGYKMVSKTVTDENGNPVGLISDDAELNQFSFNMQEYDVYITIKFDVETYNITYFDMADGNLVKIDAAPNPSTYTALTESFQFTRPDNVRGKYWKFTGWKEVGKDSVITGIDKGTVTKDLMLIATWEEVPLYDIVIENNSMGAIKSYVDGVEADKAAEGETVEIKAAANQGIVLKSLNYSYDDENGNKVNMGQVYDEDVINTSKTITFEMPKSTVTVSGEFKVIEYVITYLNLHESVNTNPTLYTVLDSFDLEAPVKDGWTFRGWKLITPDFSTEDEDDVKLTDITRIENSYGNLMIYADWEETDSNGNDGSIYYATVDKEIINGLVELDKTEALSNECIFVRVEEKSGYKLKALEYSQTQRDMVYSMPLARIATAKKPTVDISINKVADGIYYFVMPNSDVEVTAAFTPIVYNILYNANGGTHSNKAIYTVEDTFILSDAHRDGYTFKGWYDEKGNKVTSIQGVSGDLVLNAQWEKSTGTGDDGTSDGDNGTGNDSDGSNNGNTNGNGTGNGSDSGSNSYLDSGKVQTGDSTNIMRLIIICVICVVIMFLLIPKKKKDEKDQDIEDIDKN